MLEFGSYPPQPVAAMDFSFEWILAALVFLLANFFLGVQLLKLFWPLRMLHVSGKVLRVPSDPERLLRLAADEAQARRLVPIREAIVNLQRGEIESDEVPCRKLWLRSWVYTIATLILFYLQPSLFNASPEAMTLTLVLCQSLAAYAQGLLVKALADFRRLRIRKALEKADADLSADRPSNLPQEQTPQEPGSTERHE